MISRVGQQRGIGRRRCDPDYVYRFAVWLCGILSRRLQWLLIGHIVAPGMIWMELSWHPALWVHLSLWLPIVVLLALLLIQPAKGAVIAFQ